MIIFYKRSNLLGAPKKLCELIYTDQIPGEKLLILRQSVPQPSFVQYRFQITPGLSYLKSQPFYQRYKSILPTSLTHIVLIDQRLLTLETCCGLEYGFDNMYRFTLLSNIFAILNFIECY